MVVVVIFAGDSHLGDVDHEHVPILVSELHGPLQIFGSGHETEHFNENPWLQDVEVPLAKLGASVQGLGLYLPQALGEILVVVMLYCVIVFVEGEDARSELLSGLHRPKHRVEDLIVERLFAVETHYLMGFCLA